MSSPAFEIQNEDFQSQDCIELPVRILRRDGDTQSRVQLSAELVTEYAELMLEGIELPSVRACFDGISYWLTDGFHRVAAAERACKETIRVEVFRGSLTEARWDSYRANSVHGLRRTPGDLRLVVGRALGHERSANLSNCELARYLKVSEKTIRRVRNRLSSAHAEDERIAIRNGRPYTIQTRNIGKIRREPQKRSNLEQEERATLARRLVADLLVMDREASVDVRRILNIFRNWTQRAPDPLNVLESLETVIAELKVNRVPSKRTQQTTR